MVALKKRSIKIRYKISNQTFFQFQDCNKLFPSYRDLQYLVLVAEGTDAQQQL